jgi:hypothetical protein
MLFRRPISVILGIVLKQYAALTAERRKKELQTGFWNPIKSTKKL